MSLNFLFEGCFLLLTLSGFAICQPSGNPSGSRVFESTRGASSEPLASVQGPRTENKFKDYQNWSLLRLYPSNSKTLKTLIDVIGSNAQAIVLNVQRKGSKFKIDVAISPEVTLSQLLSSSKNLPVLCCLDKAITQHQENKSQRPLKKSSSHAIDDFVRSPSVNVSHCVFPDDNPARDKYSNTGYTRPYRSLEFLKWVTISKHFKEIFNLATSRQLGTEDLFGWSRYYRYDNILQFSKNLANTSDNVGYIKTGVSYEGRELFALVFATKPRLVLRRYERKASVADRLLALGGIRFYQKTSQPQTPKEGPSSDKINRNKVLKKGKSKNSKLKEKNKKKKQSIDKSKTKKKESIKGNGKKQKVRKPRPFILIEAGKS
ncbi:hypothetical protein SK128_003493 [Halocaridina rubra]|uniref:Uncharacterized protein n=1 Tax=Halocaridina rubra TaxID=373956 RepID=A0AAN8WRX8_HALRR